MKLFSSIKSALIAALCAAMTSSALAAPPVNDDFADATVITGDTGTATGTNVEATLEVDEPSFNGGFSGSSVWWKWTAPSSGQFRFTTDDSNFDTAIAVATGTAVNALTIIAENDDGPGVGTSSVTFAAVSGTDYYIAVVGYSDGNDPAEEGDVALAWEPFIFPIGEISIYKATGSSVLGENLVQDIIPASASTTTNRFTETYYVIYDHVNGRSAFVSYFVIRFGTQVEKLYSAPLAVGGFPLQIVPGRLPNTTRWTTTGGATNSAFSPADPGQAFLGEGSVGSSTSFSGGSAAPVALSSTIRITVPRQIKSVTHYNELRLSSSFYDQDLDEIVNDDFTTRAFFRSTGNYTENLDIPLSLKANRDDLTVGSQVYPKGSVENGLNLVIQTLERQGFVSNL
jgi:hypothetical protein